MIVLFRNSCETSVYQRFNIVLQGDFFKFPPYNFCRLPGTVH